MARQNKKNMNALDNQRKEDHKKASWMRQFLTCFGLCACVEVCC